jgi:hypothetical protein
LGHLVFGELLQFREPHNACVATYCPAAEYASCHSCNKGVFVQSTELFSFFADVPFAFAVFVIFFAATIRASGRNGEFWC